MRLARRSFRARVGVQTRDGCAPVVVIHCGIVSFECSLDEARQLAIELVNGIETAQNGRGADGNKS
jgi:hypothetical protein